MQDISEGKVNLVITKDLSRLGRNHIQTSYFIEILSPDKNNWTKAGGTLIKFGKCFRIDTGAMWGLHMHMLNSGHLPIGAVIAGLIGIEH